MPKKVTVPPPPVAIPPREELPAVTAEPQQAYPETLYTPQATTTPSELVPSKPDSAAVALWSRERLELLKRTIAKGLDDTEFALFVEVCRRRKLDPFARQIFAVKRWDNKAGREVMSIQTSIDGFRLIAERSGMYLGQTSAFWCGTDGQWTDVWTKQAPPFACKLGVYKQGHMEPTWAIAYWETYAGTGPFWKKGGPHMLAKCAEALALRKAFPEDLSGLYTSDEMGAVIDVEPIADVPTEAGSDQPTLVFLKSIDQSWSTGDATMTLATDVAGQQWLFSGFVEQIDKAVSESAPLTVFYTVEMGRRIVTAVQA